MFGQDKLSYNVKAAKHTLVTKQ